MPEAFDYSRLKLTAVRLIERFGAPMVLVTSVNSGSLRNPVKAELEEDCVGVLARYASHLIDGTDILSQDRKIIMAADQVEPKVDDKVRVGGKTYSVINVNKIDPGSIVLVYELQARL